MLQPRARKSFTWEGLHPCQSGSSRVTPERQHALPEACCGRGCPASSKQLPNRLKTMSNKQAAASHQRYRPCPMTCYAWMPSSFSIGAAGRGQLQQPIHNTNTGTSSRACNCSNCFATNTCLLFSVYMAGKPGGWSAQGECTCTYLHLL